MYFNEDQLVVFIKKAHGLYVFVYLFVKGDLPLGRVPLFP